MTQTCLSESGNTNKQTKNPGNKNKTPPFFFAETAPNFAGSLNQGVETQGRCFLLIWGGQKGASCLLCCRQITLRAKTTRPSHLRSQTPYRGRALRSNKVWFRVPTPEAHPWPINELTPFPKSIFFQCWVCFKSSAKVTSVSAFQNHNHPNGKNCTGRIFWLCSLLTLLHRGFWESFWSGVENNGRDIGGRPVQKRKTKNYMYLSQTALSSDSTVPYLLDSGYVINQAHQLSFPSWKAGRSQRDCCENWGHPGGSRPGTHTSQEPGQTGDREGTCFLKLLVRPMGHESRFVLHDHHSVFYTEEHRMDITETRVRSTRSDSVGGNTCFGTCVCTRVRTGPWDSSAAVDVGPWGSGPQHSGQLPGMQRGDSP